MDRSILKELKQTIDLMEHKKMYMICILISCSAYSAYQIMISFVPMFLIKSIIGKNIKQLAFSFGILVCALLISTIIDPIVTYKFNQCISTMSLKLRIKIFSKIEKLGILQVAKYTSGDLISRITNDISSIEQMFKSEAYMLITSIIYGVGAAVSMFSLNVYFSSIIFIMAAATVITSFYFGSQLHKISSQIQKKYAVLNQYIMDSVLGSRDIKIFNVHNYLYKKYLNENKDLIKYEMEQNKINSKINTVNFLMSGINIVGAFAIGVFMVDRESLDFGTIVAIIGLQKGIIFMFERVGRYYTKVQSSLTASARIFEILDQDNDTIHKNKSNLFDGKKSAAAEAIIFDKVKFSYSNKDFIINNLSLKIGKGERIAIYGASGKGKSTLLKLILGFYSLNDGEIYVNGKMVNENNIIKIRDDIAYVPQDTFLFEGTIEQNIICNQVMYSHEDVVKSAKKANAHDFIMSLPNQYNTKIRENANNFSSGQKQRIAIARAFFKNAPIILMDEPTAALDTDSEKEIKQALEELCFGRTVIIIAHQDRILEDVSKVYILESGILIER